MAITINNGIQNISGTPGAASGVFADRPSATNVADGTLYFATDTLAIYQVIAGSWSNYSGGGGSTPTLDQVLTAGNITSNYAGFLFGDNYTVIDPLVVQLNNNSINESNSHYYNYSEFSTAKTIFRLDQSSLFISFVDTLNESKIDFSTDSIIKTIYNANGAGYIDNGLKLDFANNVFNFGNYLSGIYFHIDDVNLEIYTKNSSGNVEGIYFDFNNNKYVLGDYDYTIEGTFLNVDSKNQFIATQNHATDIGLKLDFANGFYWLGDFNGLFGNVWIKCDSQNLFITTSDAYAATLNLDLNNKLSQLGDVFSNGNSTTITIDDANQKLLLSNNLKSGTAGGSSGQHLKINVGGTDYKIALLNP